jgi:DNA modification methylase
MKTPTVQILQGDCLDRLCTLPDQSVNCCVTSPPYYGLRDYGVAGQIGLEASPTKYVAKLVAVFNGVRRVLRDDGVLWLNLGDSHAADRGGTCMPAETLAGGVGGKADYDDPLRGRVRHTQRQAHRDAPSIGLKHKDLMGIPWRVAFALQANGWYLRSDIIWHKPNPMPESVTDRPTKAHEYIFLLAKSERYYYDHEAVKEQAETKPMPRNKNSEHYNASLGNGSDRFSAGERVYGEDGMRNKRSVWTVATNPYKEAHFATFPPDLIKPCILAGCPAGGTVLDPFGGSGTTGQVALELGRNAILIELNPEYAKLIEQRTNVTPAMF